MPLNKSKSYPATAPLVADSKGRIKRPGRTIYLQTKSHRRSSFLGAGSPLAYNRFHANDNNALVPEQWARQALRILYENMVYGATVYRDYDPMVARFGETIHVHKPGEMVAKRKQNDLDDLEDQDAIATDLEVKLNQRIYTSFLLGDGERSKSFKDLVTFHLEPAMSSQSRLLDQCVGGQVMQFLDNAAGGLGTLTESNAHNYLLDMRNVFNKNKVPLQNRWLGFGADAETAMQKVEMFKKADEVGDGGRALREAILGKKAGWNNFLELNTPSIQNATKGGSTTMASAYTSGTTTFNVASGAALRVGAYITIVGDDTPLRVTAIATNAVTVNRGLNNNVASGATVQEWESALINQGSAIAKGDTTAAVSNGYPSGWMKEIAYDGSGVPKVGQLVAFSKASPDNAYTAEYCIVQVNGSNILLDRPLEDTVADNDVIDLGPDGGFNFAYQREAVALVNRPLVAPPSGTGVRSISSEYKNMSMRVNISWDPKKEATRVTVSGLFGIKKLEGARGGVLLS